MCRNDEETSREVSAVQEALILEHLLHSIGLRVDGIQSLIRTHPRDVITQCMDFFGINYSNLSNEANSIIRDLEEFEDKSLDQIVQDIFLRDTLDNIKHQLRWIAAYVKEHTHED